MKILITNPDAIYNPESNEFYHGIEDVLNDFIKGEDQDIVVISVDAAKLKPIPKKFNPMQVSGAFRGGRGLIEAIQEELGVQISDILVLGCKQIDVGLAANSKLILLRADYAKDENADESLFQKGYGVGIEDAVALQIFLDKFLPIKTPWFYKCQVSETTIMYSLTNANTKAARDHEIIKLSHKFKANLKDGDDSFKEEFLIYFLMSTYTIFKEINKVDYWGIYPSSGTDINEDLEYFKDKARIAYNCRTKEPIFVRHSAATKRHTTSTESRLTVGADEELATIRLNDHYKYKLKGKTVCIIDDFSNVGSSCECARAILENAGVAHLIFITLGKFGKIYKSFNYKIEGDPFGKFTFKKGKQEMLAGEFNSDSDLEFIESLGDIVK